MASIELGSGTTINVKIPLPQAITEYENVFVSVYSNPASPVKFSYILKSGYNKLNIGMATNQLVGKLTAAQSANMRGELYMTMRLIDEIGENEDIGNSKPILLGINLIDNNLKNAL